MHVDQVVQCMSQAAVIFMFNIHDGFGGYYSSWVDISSPGGLFIPALKDHSSLIGIHVGLLSKCIGPCVESILSELTVSLFLLPRGNNIVATFEKLSLFFTYLWFFKMSPF